MAIVALISWLVTVGFGSWMLAVWVRNGGLQHAAGGPGTSFAAARVFSHFGLAAAGLIVWLVYLAVDRDFLAWIAFGLLLLVALLGGLLVARWSADRRGPVEQRRTDLAEQRIPVVAVAAHGGFAVLTLVLVLITALRY